jgi:hypothetical protein
MTVAERGESRKAGREGNGWGMCRRRGWLRSSSRGGSGMERRAATPTTRSVSFRGKGSGGAEVCDWQPPQFSGEMGGASRRIRWPG